MTEVLITRFGNLRASNSDDDPLSALPSRSGVFGLLLAIDDGDLSDGGPDRSI